MIALFSLPIIPIIFAVLRLVMANATNKNVDPVKFQLYSMLENNTAIITSCLPSLRLFIVNTRDASNQPGSLRYYARGQKDYFDPRMRESYSMGRRGESCRTETLIETSQQGEEGETMGDASSGESQTGLARGLHSPRVMVTQEFIVK